SLAPPDEKPPRLQAGDCAIEPLGDASEGAGLAQCCDTGQLFVGRAAAFDLELMREAAAVVGGEQLRDDGRDADARHDRRRERRAITRVGRMEREYARRAARAQVLEDSALDGIFRPTAVAGAAANGGLIEDLPDGHRLALVDDRE